MSLLILLVWLIGSQRNIKYTSPTGETYALFLCCIYHRQGIYSHPPGWSSHPSGDPLRLQWFEYYGLVRPLHPVLGDGIARLPLWLPLVIAVALTATLFHFDRRRIPPGHCKKCGYNLTGNVSGICSECGHSLDSAESSASTHQLPHPQQEPPP